VVGVVVVATQLSHSTGQLALVSAAVMEFSQKPTSSASQLSGSGAPLHAGGVVVVAVEVVAVAVVVVVESQLRQSALHAATTDGPKMGCEQLLWSKRKQASASSTPLQDGTVVGVVGLAHMDGIEAALTRGGGGFDAGYGLRVPTMQGAVAARPAGCSAT
jgi:hypothetical protein